MRNWQRENIKQDYLARFNRGEITRGEYLTAMANLLMQDQREQQTIVERETKKLESVTAQIAEIEAELATIV